MMNALSMFEKSIFLITFPYHSIKMAKKIHIGNTSTHPLPSSSQKLGGALDFYYFGFRVMSSIEKIKKEEKEYVCFSEEGFVEEYTMCEKRQVTESSFTTIGTI